MLTTFKCTHLALFCVFLAGCMGVCQDPPTLSVKYELKPNTDTVALGDTLYLQDLSFCHQITVSCYSINSPLYILFGSDSIGSFLQKNGQYAATRTYSDSLRKQFDYDTTRHLNVKLVMNGGRGLFVVNISGQNVYSACSNGVTMAEHAVMQKDLYDTVYVR